MFAPFCLISTKTLLLVRDLYGPKLCFVCTYKVCMPKDLIRQLFIEFSSTRAQNDTVQYVLL